MVLALGALVAGGAIVGAWTNRGETTQRDLVSPSYSPVGTLSLSTTTTLPRETGFRGTESFCAVPPLTGTIHYDGTRDTLAGVLTASVGGLPPDDEVNINWSNDSIRAPVIAAFMSDPNGNSIPSSMEVGRLGEIRAVEIVLTAASVPNPVVGHLEPC